MKLLGRALVLALLAVLVSCDGQQKQQQQQITDNAGSAASSDGSGKAAAAGSSGANDRPQYNKRGAPEIQTIVGTPQHAYLNQPVGAGGAASGLVTGTSSIAAVAPAAAVAYATYAHPQQHQQQQHQQLVQASSIGSPQTIYHKINYVAPGSTLKVATYAAAAPAHYEYASAIPGLSKYQYAAAAAYPQYQYAAYPQQHQIQQQQQPQYQVYQHHQTVQLPAASAIISAAPHPHQTVATLPGHHQLQPGTTIYAAHQPAATFHYTLTQPTQHQQQQHNYQQQQSAGHPGTFTYHQAVPVVHQAPIAAIGQVHHHQQQQQQQQQVAANQYPVVPTAAAPLYATASTSPNQFYHQATNYGDPDTLTNFNTSPRPTVTSWNNGGFKPYNRKTQVKPVVEYDYDRDRFTSGEEPCENDFQVYDQPSDKKKKNGTSTFDRNLQTLIRTYGVATALLRASNQAVDRQDNKKKTKTQQNGDNTDRIQLIHPPSDGDKKLKAGKGGSSNGGGRKYYHYHYDHDHDDYHHGGDGYGRRGYDKHSYRRTLDQ